MSEKEQLEDVAADKPADPSPDKSGPEQPAAHTVGVSGARTVEIGCGTGQGTRPDASAWPPESSIARAERILTVGPGADDYLPVGAEVSTAVDRDLEYAHSRGQGQGLPLEIAVRQFRQRLLASTYAGQNIAYIADDTGVVVLAVGPEQIGRLINEIPYEKRKNVVFTAPEVWW